MISPGETVLERYRIDAPLGEGGFGSVYVATDLRTNKRVAVKIIHPPEGMDPLDAATLMEREIKALMLIDHPGVVRLLDWQQRNDGSACIVTELLVGTDLERAIELRGPVPIAAAIALFDEVLAALAVAHGHAIVHRDIKPANIFLCTNGRVVLLDFGIARATEEGSSKTMARSANTGLMGTPYFFAPERVAGLPTGTFSDVFAFGGTLFFALTGVVPFGEGAKSMIAVIDAIARNERRAIAEVRTDVPSGLAAFVEKCLAYKPPDRFADAGAAKRALAQVVAATTDAHEALRRYASKSTEETSVVAVPSQEETSVVAVPSQTVVATVAATVPITAPAKPPKRRALWPYVAAAVVPLAIVSAFLLRPKPVEKRVETPPAPASQPEALPTPAAIEAPIVPDAPKPPPPAAKSGVVKVVLHQWADVTIDGAAQGRKQSAARFTVGEGAHSIVFSRPGFPSRSARVKVSGGDEVVVHLDFERGLP
ncbi:MAG: protein kinase [Deltaproteobacteria bacterium]|nr:protein kinase [Deltaproteobacteria bacterium]